MPSHLFSEVSCHHSGESFTLYLQQSLYISFININHVSLYFSISGNIYVYFIVIFLVHFVLKNNLDQWYQSRLLLIIFQCMSPTSSEYSKLGLEIVSLKDNHSRSPKKPSMEEEKKNDRAEDYIRLLQTFVGNLFGAKFHKGVWKNQHILKRGSACFIHSCG